MKLKNTYLTATDQFCGAGGTTSGAKEAGIEVKLALNHWDRAIETHNTNHPEVSHDCTDISACDPRRYRPTNILYTSPECTNHSLAKGQKRNHQGQGDLFQPWTPDPAAERSRATMWDVPRFAEYHDYEVVVVENVVDARKWRMWDAWLMAMHALGYQHKCLYLNSMFFLPCPQSRDRMYVVFWKKGNQEPDLEYRPIAPCPKCGDKEAYQSWKRPERKFGKYKQQYVYRCSCCYQEVTPYYFAAFNIIDWQVPITRIGDRKKPLSPKTISRVKHGLDKHGQQIQIHRDAYHNKVQVTGKPLSTQTARQDANLLIPPAIIELRGRSNSRSSLSAMSTQTSNINHGIAFSPQIVELRRTGKTRSAFEALATVTAGGLNHALLVGNYTPGWTRTLDQPTGTMTTTAQQSIVTTDAWNSFISYYYGQTQTSSLTDALRTVTTMDRAAIVQGSLRVEDCYYRCLKAHEVQRAMAFLDDYIILGNAKEKVKQLGNAVTPPVMTWISKQIVKSLT